MAKGGRKSKEMKHVGFRMPLDVYQDYVMIAESRGVDLSAVFNWTLHEFRPTLLLKHAQHQTAMLRAAVADPEQNAVEGGDKPDPLAALNDLVRQIQELASILHARSCKDDDRLAA
jgi:hypothetical protein